MVAKQVIIPDKEIYKALLSVSDPEIPVLSVLDLGVVRRVTVEDRLVIIDLTPTYTGCPAMDTMAQDITFALEKLGFEAKINFVLSPAWSTDWLSDDGRQKLEAYGIAAPLDEQLDKAALLHGKKEVSCTHCQSKNTRLVSEFGSTACKALFQCEDCMEPFDYFKCLK